MCPRASQFGDTVHLIKFTRAGNDLQAAVKDTHLDAVRTVVENAGLQWKLQTGACVLLYPNQYNSVLTALKSFQLWPHHVLINEAFLPLLLNAIQKLPSRANVKPGVMLPEALVGDDDGSVAIVEKTFFNFEPRQLAHAVSVTQSFADARHGMNPRR